MQLFLMKPYKYFYYSNTVVFIIFIFIDYVENKNGTHLIRQNSEYSKHEPKIYFEQLDNKFILNNNYFYNEDNYKTFPIRLFQTKFFEKKCNSKRCYPPYGICSEENTCKCLKGYLNHIKIDKSLTDKYCSYKMKNQILALSLELITFVGGNIYLGYVKYSLIKATCIITLLIVFLLELPCRICGFRDELDYKCSLCEFLKTGTFILFLFGIITWQLADMIKIFSDDAIDSNSMPLFYSF